MYSLTNLHLTKKIMSLIGGIEKRNCVFFFKFCLVVALITSVIPRSRFSRSRQTKVEPLSSLGAWSKNYQLEKNVYFIKKVTWILLWKYYSDTKDLLKIFARNEEFLISRNKIKYKLLKESSDLEERIYIFFTNIFICLI